MLPTRIGFFLSLSAMSLTAWATTPPKVPADNPCSNDIHKYCGDVTPGEGRLAQCMKQHASELSSGCKKFGEEYKKEHPEVASGKASKNPGKG